MSSLGATGSYAQLMATEQVKNSVSPVSGRLLSALANAMVRLYADSYGRGPTKAKTHWADDVITVVLEDIWTTSERTLLEGGHSEHVHATRRLFQEVKRAEFVGVVEELTGRRVKAFLSQAHLDPDLAIEVFILHPEG